MKKLYSIYDTRAKQFITDVICADSDIQANGIFQNYTKTMREMKIGTYELLMMKIGDFDSSKVSPISTCEMEEVPSYIIEGE